MPTTEGLKPADRRFLVFRETEGRAIVHPVEVTGRGENYIEHCERGMIRRVRDDQFVDDLNGQELLDAGGTLP